MSMLLKDTKHFGMQRQPTYTELRNEALPPIHELVAEHKRMLMEMAAAERIEASSFLSTMTSWHDREERKHL